MNTFWLKIAGVAVLVVGVIILITVFTSGTDSEPQEPQKTVYDQWEEDDKRLRAEPQYQEPLATIPSVQQTTPVAPLKPCLLYTSPSPRDRTRSRMPSSA